MFKTHFLAKLNFKTAAKIILSLGILLLIVLRLDMQALWLQLKELDGVLWCVALGFMALQVFALACRWQYLVNNNTHRIEYVEALQITLASLLANYIFIASISGVFVRIGLTVQHGFSLVKTVCAAVIDRLLTLFALVLLAAIFLPLLPQYIDLGAHMGSTMYQTTILGLSIFIILSLVFAPLFFRKVLKDRILSNRKYASSLNYIRNLIAQPILVTKILVASLLGQVFYFISIYFLAMATDAHPQILALLVVLPAMILVASLPISFGGWGVREGAFIYGLGLIGIPMETAFLISVQIGIMGMVTVMLIGVPVVMGSDLARIRYQASFAAKNCARLFSRS